MRSSAWLWVLLGLACTDKDDATTETAEPTPPEPSPPEPTLPEEPWCEVSALFATGCVTCHLPSNLKGELDLATDPEAALVNVPSATFEGVLVVPGDAEGSLLYRKMAGTQSPDQGGIMPPTGILGQRWLKLVEVWIEAGPSFTCSTQTAR